MTIEDVQGWADEVARLMASRFGGARRGTSPALATMMKRRGRALPRRHRRAAALLASHAGLAANPRTARQVDTAPLREAHRQLVEYLRPLGSRRRFTDGLLHVGAAVALGLLVVGALAVWLMVRRGAL